MQNVNEMRRYPSPAPRPQPLAFYDGRLWMGSWETDHVYAIDPRSWSVATDLAAPGKPYGIASFGGGLSVVVSIGADDDRYLYRCDPSNGFDSSSKMECPDLTGSHLAADGPSLYLCQQGNRRILALDSRGTILRTIALPTRCAGFGFGPGGVCFMISADEEFDNLTFARFDVRESNPTVEPIATMPPEARSLAFDGTTWWTSLREANEIAAFAPPT